MRASEENLTIARNAKGIFVDGCQRETVLYAVVLEFPRLLVEDGEALIGGKYQFAAHRRLLRVVDAIADESVRLFVEVLEVIRCRAIQVETAA